MFASSWLLAAGLALSTGPGAAAVPPTGEVQVLDDSGRAVATVDVRPGATVELGLPPGRYRVVGRDGTKHPDLVVEDGGSATLGHADPVAEPSSKDAPFPPPEPHDGESEPVPPATPAKWKSWGSPLLSAVIPGVGQAVNGKGGRSLAVLATLTGLALGTAALVLTRPPHEGATKGDRGDSGVHEVARLSALATLTTAMGIVYLGQIFDAHALGRGRGPTPKKDYSVEVSFQRFTTIGMRPGEPAYALYDDFAMSVMGQAVPRVSVGIADMSAKFGDRRGAYVVQGGPRAMYRFFDRKQVWLEVGGGAILQGASSPKSGIGLEESESEEVDRAFGAIPYAQFGVEWFPLDRWSLGLSPRVSVPLTDRYYARGRKIPRYATTFELGAKVGVHF